MNLVQKPVAAAVVILFASCASIMTGSTDTVTVESIPCGAYFRSNTGARGRTPQTVIVPASEDLVVDYRLEGYEPQSAVAKSRVSAWIAGNILFGGLIGLVIDIVNPDARTHDSKLRVQLVPTSVAATDALEGEGAHPERIQRTSNVIDRTGGLRFTMAMFDDIEYGMSYEDVAGIVGSEGRPSSTSPAAVWWSTPGRAGALRNESSARSRTVGSPRSLSSGSSEAGTTRFGAAVLGGPRHIACPRLNGAVLSGWPSSSGRRRRSTGYHASGPRCAASPLQAAS